MLAVEQQFYLYYNEQLNISLLLAIYYNIHILCNIYIYYNINRTNRSASFDLDRQPVGLESARNIADRLNAAEAGYESTYAARHCRSTVCHSAQWGCGFRWVGLLRLTGESCTT